MRRRLALPPVLALTCAVVVAGCGGSTQPTKAEKERARRARDAELLALPYPASSGTQPKSMVITYDGAGDRTIMTLRLTDLRADGAGGSRVSAVTLHLTSSHKGRVRAPDDPEGSVDGSITARTPAPGTLAYSGAPGTITIDGTPRPLREASGKDHYASIKIPGGAEERVRFRIQTEDLVAAANADNVSITFGTIRVVISNQHLADLREFAARMNPKK